MSQEGQHILTVLNRTYRGKTLRVVIPYRVELIFHIEKVVEVGLDAPFYVFVYSMVEEYWMSEPYTLGRVCGNDPVDTYHEYAEKLISRYFTVVTSFMYQSYYIYWDFERQRRNILPVKEYHEQD